VKLASRLIGIDLGGTKIEAAVLGTDGQVAWRQRVATPQGDYEGTLQAIRGLVEAARGHAPDAPGVGRDVRVVRSGFRVDGATPAPDRPPPVLGADTDAILREAGYDDEAIARLRAEGVA
jgi:crotonobetainyl-CoA:carnitine CoA-transferase CaiB-like acyl-CoA transferase